MLASNDKPESEWDSIPVKHLVEFISKGETPPEIDNGNIQYIWQGSIHYEGLNSEVTKKTTQGHGFTISRGDVLMNALGGGTVGRCCEFTSDLESVADGNIIIMRPRKKTIKGGFLALNFATKYWIDSVEKVIAVGATNQISIRKGDIGNIKIRVPKLNYQNLIFEYVESRTNNIKQQITLLNQHIEYLQERFSTLIKRVVTKGLNPNVPMKDSGIDWIGEIPQHWDLKKVKFVSKIFRGKFGHRPRNDPKLFDGDYPFIQTGNVARANKYITEYTQTLNDLGRSVSEEFPAGTIVMAIAANIGDVAILTFDACFPDSIIGFNPNLDMNQEYVYYSLSALASELDKVASQSTQQNLNIELVGNLMIPTPPETEQIIIGKYISEIEQTYSHSKEKIETLISKLMEYRTALISAAVTGKIDVRGYNNER